MKISYLNGYGKEVILDLPAHDIPTMLSNRMLFGLGLEHPRFTCTFLKIEQGSPRDDGLTRGVAITFVVHGADERENEEAERMLRREFLGSVYELEKPSSDQPI